MAEEAEKHDGSKESPKTDTPIYPARKKKRESQVLKTGLISTVVLRKIQVAARRMDVNKRVLGFYLLELKKRQLYRKFGCSSFRQLVKLKTGLKPRYAEHLVQMASALESLPLLDEAFSKGQIYWSAIRAIIRVAKPHTEKYWVEYAKTHRTDEVEREVAARHEGEKPGEGRGKKSQKKYPCSFKVAPEVHLVFEQLANLLSKKTGSEVTVQEALFEAAKRMVAEEIQNDGADGEKRKLPNGFCLVVYMCPNCREYAVATPDGPVRIPRETAEELTKGAEVRDLTKWEAASRNGNGIHGAQCASNPADQKTTAGSLLPSQVSANPQSPDEGVAEPTGAENSARIEQPEGDKSSSGQNGTNVSGIMDSDPEDQKATAGPLLPSQVPANSQSPDEDLNNSEKVKHADNLCTPDTPRVPKEERDQPTSPELRKAILSRDGYFCRTPGCDNMVDDAHHMKELAKGGLTNWWSLLGLCESCHDIPVHSDGTLWISGTSDKPIYSDFNYWPLFAPPSSQPNPVEFEVEHASKTESTETEATGSDSTESDSPALFTIPCEISPDWWKSYQHLFEWSAKLGALVFHPENALEEPAGLFQEEQKTSGSSPNKESLQDFLGQTDTVRNLSIALRAARIRQDLPSNILLSGPPGLGKTSLANRIAVELGARLHAAFGPMLKDPACLIGILSGLKKGDVLFIDEIHGLPQQVAESLYQAMDERVLSVNVVAGSTTRVVKLGLEPFLLVGATTEESLLPRPFHSRFGIKEHLEFYSRSELEMIARNEGRRQGVEISPRAASILAGGSRGTPRNLLSLLAQARDLALLERGRAEGVRITSRTAAQALENQGIDTSGLDRLDRKILRVLLERGRPMSLRTLSDILGEDRRTILEVHEPYLIRENYLRRTQKGRVATELARGVIHLPE